VNFRYPITLHADTLDLRRGKVTHKSLIIRVKTRWTVWLNMPDYTMSDEIAAGPARLRTHLIEAL